MTSMLGFIKYLKVVLRNNASTTIKKLMNSTYYLPGNYNNSILKIKIKIMIARPG